MVCCERSLCGVLSLDRSMEMGRRVKDSLVGVSKWSIVVSSLHAKQVGRDVQ